ncbi:MAG: helicase-exonuclease AddAB subunit AddA [Lachnospiraceae bacterium]|nr:helicase-exonuclease AddAB subunit AddA [Lachnospiraceae bacterium]MEE0960451.1 helicase-exonuclease AddAB subunit AddA [Lachnospiraceae bacterium]
MATSWTKEQQSVIDLRNRNLLISAAAGSGKTAVLVERIIKMVTDTKNPVDIDKLCVVTFTNAAAAEMKERILLALNNALDEDSDNEHLKKQISLVHTAKITTIDSFCLDIVRNNFNSIDIDPSFRIADPDEAGLVKADVMENMLEDYYEEGKPEFIDFVETYSSGNKVSGLEDIIDNLYTFSTSHPWPKIWLNKCRELYEIKNDEEFENTAFARDIKTSVKSILKDARRMLNTALRISREAMGPLPYEETLLSDIDNIDILEKAKTVAELSDIFSQLSFGKLKRVVTKNSNVYDEYLKDRAKTLRDSAKALVESIRSDYFAQPLSTSIEDIKNSASAVNMLIDLVLDFTDRFEKKKKEKNIADFADIEHMALNVLIQHKNDNKNTEEFTYTAVADEMSKNFSEILIDEYQDSNLVQDYIMKSISRERFDMPNNIFMVGDVKQSIYKFRLARPELFMEKYDTYTDTESDNQKIELRKNFRSRSNVLSSINYIFYKIMKNEVGSVDYTESVALYTGASYPEFEDKEWAKTKILLLDTDEEILNNDDNSEIKVKLNKKEDADITENGSDNEDEELTKAEKEARLVANEIIAMMSGKIKAQVTDKVTGELRDVRYSDIVILLRSQRGYAETFVKVLTDAGIPAFSEQKSGYFDAIEVATILNFIRIIDNPVQDIPLTAVMKSQIIGITVNELAIMRTECKDGNMYNCMMWYKDNGKNKDIKRKLNKLANYINEYSKRAIYTDIHILIKEIMVETGYYNYVTAMPSGIKRKGNLDMLVEKAKAYESTSFRGLFNFVRYIEQLKKYNVDYGEASESGESDNIVRLMTIHKSKGLEFPVVFLSGCGKQFNSSDTRGSLVIHPDLGIGTDYIDYEERVKTATLYKKAIASRLKEEVLGEELRVLYVALTRAREKLYITGCVKGMAKTLKGWCESAQENPDRLSYTTLIKAKNYLDFIMPAVLTDKNIKPTVRAFGIEEELEVRYGDEEANSDAEFAIEYYTIQDLIRNTVDKEVSDMAIRDVIEEYGNDKSMLYDKINDRLNYVYHDIIATKIHSKMSVSEIKKIGQNVDEEESEFMFLGEEELMMPEFLAPKEEIKATTRGTAYHKFLELLDYERCKNTDMIKEMAIEFATSGKMPQEYVEMINPFDILYFVKSDIGQRMKAAYERGTLVREQQFVMSVPYSEIEKEYNGDEEILVQGIIDAYFVEDGRIVIVDYKTDRAKDAKELIDRYQVQLDFYEKAVNKTSENKVKEKVIYAFALKTGIILN